MSIALMTLAFKTTLPSTQKFVLVALCDSANDQGECYPSVPTLAIKCSMGVRTVQDAMVALESTGQLRREFRTGRSTVYWLTPVADEHFGENHYVYRIDDDAAGEFYIGVRTCRGDPARDSYMGSGIELSGRNRSSLRKTIIAIYATRLEAEAGEFEHVDASIGNVGCINVRRPPTPAAAAPRSSRTTQIAHHTPADCAPPPPQQPHPTPAAAAPITVNEPSVESKRKKKSAPTSVAPDLLVAAGFTPEVAEEFIACKAERKAPLTPRAWADHVREAAKAGWSAVAAAEKVMAKTWKGFEAKYVAEESPGRSGKPFQTAKERDTANAAAWFSKSTGGLLGCSFPPDDDVIEMEIGHAAQIGNH